MIEALWNRHYHPGLTGSYSGDMAHAFRAMLFDSDIDATTERKLRTAIAVHCRLERLPTYNERRKWFCELFGLPHERIA